VHEHKSSVQRKTKDETTKSWGGRGSWRGKDTRTVVILGGPEGAPRLYGEKLHILDAVGLRRAPDHDVEPSARQRRGVLMASPVVGLGSPRGAEEERPVEIQNEELARRLGERFGGRRRRFEVGGRWTMIWRRLLGVVV